jgi:hypothetical protein
MKYEDPSRPVGLLVGLEADTDPKTNTYWRLGFTYPVQVTQWALACAPGHPILIEFMSNLKALIRDMRTSQSASELDKVDPVMRTGPVAFTLAASSWLESVVQGFRWNGVTGLKDGGKSKLVFDVLVLPITAFRWGFFVLLSVAKRADHVVSYSPGRSGRSRMGSKPVSDVDARLCHHFLGSWKHFNLTFEYGKFCRIWFGRCKDWPKSSV